VLEPEEEEEEEEEDELTSSPQPTGPSESTTSRSTVPPTPVAAAPAPATVKTAAKAKETTSARHSLNAKTEKPPTSLAEVRRMNRSQMIGYGYAIVLPFLALFFISLRYLNYIHEGLGTPVWSLIVSGALVAPLLAPIIAKYVAPRIKSIKISEFEVTLSEATASNFSLKELSKQLNLDADQVTAPEYASRMTSYSAVIIDTIKRVRETKDEVLVVDLQTGNAWIPPNLHFLASLAARRTRVEIIAFVETRHEEGAYVGACTPEELKAVLEKEFPVFQQAVSNFNLETASLDANMGGAYFSALQTLYVQTGETRPVREMWLTSAKIYGFAKGVMQRQQIAYNDTLTAEDFRQILLSKNKYTAVVDDETLISLVKRETVALFVAQSLARESVGQSA
jgi:hypothetical protein